MDSNTPSDGSELIDCRVGDKVRIKAGPHTGARGVINGCSGDHGEVTLTDGTLVSIALSDCTNFSLAARRAWAVMPKRAGRPKLANPRTRMVSMRMDVDVWRMLSRAAEFGLIPSREQAVNAWLRERAEALLAAAPPMDTLSAEGLARLRSGVEPDGATEREERTKHG